MKLFLKIKYSLYLIVGGYCILSLFLWWNIFSMILFLCGILLTTYSLLCLRKHKNIFEHFPKIFQYVCRIGVSLLIVSFLIVESFVITRGIRKDDVKTDYILVLGAAIVEDQPSEALRYRLDEAYIQYQKNPEAIIICSGGKAQGTKYSEAEVMKRYLLKLGVREEDILLEEQSYSTYENLYNSYLLVNDSNATFLIITNGFHAFRAKFIANQIGMKAYSAPSLKMYRGISVNYVREYFSFLKTLITD